MQSCLTMKETGIAKCMKRKWSTNTTVAQKGFSPSKSQQTSHSFLQVENGVHFVMDGEEFEFSASLPSDKNIELSRKTYSKKNPITFHPLLSPDRTDTFENEFSTKPQAQNHKPTPILKCPSSSSRIKNSLKKGIVSTEIDSTLKNEDVKKMQKKTVHFKPCKTTLKSFDSKLKPRSKSLGESSKMTLMPPSRPYKTSLKSFDKKLAKPSRSRSLGSTLEEEDSDIEVLEVKLFKQTPLKSTNQNGRKVSSAQNGYSSKRKSRDESEVEIVPSKRKCDTNLASHSYTAVDETLINEADIAPFMPTNPNGLAEIQTTSNTMRWLSSNGCMAVTKIEHHSASTSTKMPKQVKPLDPLEMPESPQVKQAKGRRELKSLFENLNEISWAHEASFKNMLCNSAAIRHSQRAALRDSKTGKVLRKLKASVGNATMGKSGSTLKNLALKRSYMAKMNQMKAKPIARNKIVPMMHKIRKQNFAREKGLVPTGKMKMNAKTKMQLLKMSGRKMTVSQLKPTVLPQELSPDESKMKALVPKLKPSEIKLKPNTPKMKVSVPKVKSEPEPSTSGVNDINCIKQIDTSVTKQHKVPKYLKNFEKFQAHKKMEVMQNGAEKKNIHPAVQKGSKLQVMLRPLEHTNFWTPSFYEEFRKNFLDQALHRAIESKDHDSIAVMFQELLNSVLSPQNNNVGIEKIAKKKKPEEEALRSSVRQSEGAFRYKEIVVKKHQNYIQVVLVPNEIKQNCLTIEAMKEIRDAFLLAKKDPNCRAVLLNSSGRYFCSGIDLSQIVGSNKKQVAEEMSNTIQDLVLTLGTFTKPVIAAVNGATYGFGVSLLTYCDVVLASDKATFCVPAIRLGYLPEGGLTLTLPHVVGTVRANEILMQGRCLTAEEALKYGLVSELMWPTTLMNNVIPRLQKIISQPLQAMEATKTMIRCHLWDKLKSHVDRERRLVRELWLTAHCQNNIKRLLQTGYLID